MIQNNGLILKQFRKKILRLFNVKKLHDQFAKEKTIYVTYTNNLIRKNYQGKLTKYFIN